jgi:spore coat protein U-like protein
MISTMTRWLTAVVLLVATVFAQAAITCTSPVTGGFSTTYAPTQTVNNATQGTITFNCTRGVAGDATSVIVASTTGLNALGTIARAKLGASFIQYDGYKDSACTQLWTNPTIANSITATLLPILTSQPVTISYWGCITLSGQVVPAGTYVDTIQMGVFTTTGTAISPQPTFSVAILNPATCTITSVANVAFGTYVALQSTPLVSPAANVVMNCTSNLPYSLALDATTGLIAGVGLNYSLATSWTAGSQLRGTGPGQTFTMTGTLPANQAGTCSTGSCTGSDTRTLTVTY